VHRIYFDVNSGDNKDRYDLGIPGSLKDIEPIADQLSDGLRVVLFDSDGLEVEATIEFDKHHNRWMARPIWETLKK
jgi:hypothetical protein